MYKLIVRRFLAIFYPPAEYEKISVTVEIEKEIFTASAKICVNNGFLDVLRQKANKQSTTNSLNVENSVDRNEKNVDTQEKNNQDVENSNLNVLKSLKKGMNIEIQNFEIKEAETSPPTRYNSGSIILAMENAGKLIEDEALREQIKGAGIGTSATRAEIMKKLERIRYIEINNKTQIITPTKKGEAIFDIVNNSMPDMLNPKLTASWEKGLEMVAKKEIQENEFMNKLEVYVKSKFNKLVVKW